MTLLGGRFLVNLTGTDPRTGRVALGAAIPQTDRFGYFSLPDFTGDATLPEVVVKMVDATGSPSLGASFWVFHAPLTDVGYTVSVTDLESGRVRLYVNDPAATSQLCGGVDTSAFPPR